MRGNAQLRTGYWLLTGPHNQRKWGTGKHPNLTLVCSIKVNLIAANVCLYVRCHVTPGGPGFVEINRLSWLWTADLIPAYFLHFERNNFLGSRLIIFSYFLIMIIFSTIGQKWRWLPLPEMSPDTTKTPEMNELESDKFPLKIWAHNFEKHKSYIFWKIIKKFDFLNDFWDAWAMLL